jgi:DNA-directed RNA polymerase
MLHGYVLTISEHLSAYLAGKHPEGRRRNKYAKLLDTVETDKVALFALRSVIGAVFNDGASLATVCKKIGRSCEDELRFMKFQEEYKEYYDTLIRDFERRGTTSYKHKRRVLAAKSTDKGMLWNSWSDIDTFGVGALVISLLMEVCDLVEQSQERGKGGKSGTARVVPTAQCLDWITKHNDVVELTSPDRMPCIVEPDPWTSVSDGGYYSPGMRRITPLIKVRGSSSLRTDLYNNAEMPEVLSAINAMQSTAWTVNTKVLEVMQEVWNKNLGCGMPRSEPYVFPACPLADEDKVDAIPEGDPRLELFNNWKAETRELHTLEKERVAKNLSLVRTIRIANEMKAVDEFWYVYQCDFRGRVYCTSSGLNPQGTDQSKGLIQFSKGKKIGKRGMYWLKVHGANKYGNDKGSYDDRVRFIDENADKWQAVGEDPITHRSVWAEADKPYQFLAWCFEYRAMSRQPYPETFVSHLPIGLDGSCNGLQHFSAMLLDAVGGKAVNLIPSETPEDIYQDVADTCLEKVKELASFREGGAVNWYTSLPDNVIPRGLPKKPVMTLPYGSTQQSCTASIYSWQHENLPHAFPNNTQFKHALYLSPILWESISEVVIAARAAMDWIQECSSVLSKAGHPMQYNSPLGFPVLQSSMKYISKQIETQIGGRLRVRIATYTDKLNGRKQRQGSSPNLVHHVDACHMMMTINAMTQCEDDISFAMIHDDFGTHAADTDALHLAIRNQFFRLHNEYDILADFKRVHEERHDIELPDLPPKGNLDLSGVLRSNYFFG